MCSNVQRHWKLDKRPFEWHKRLIFMVTEFSEFSLKYSSVGRGENCSLEVAYYRPNQASKMEMFKVTSPFHCWDKMNFAWSRKFYWRQFYFGCQRFSHTLGNCKNWETWSKTHVVMKKFTFSVFSASLFVWKIFSWSTLVIIISLEILRFGQILILKCAAKIRLDGVLNYLEFEECFENYRAARNGLVLWLSEIETHSWCCWVSNAKYAIVTSICFEWSDKACYCKTI